MIVAHEAVGWVEGVGRILEVPIRPEGLLPPNRHRLADILFVLSRCALKAQLERMGVIK